MMNESPYLIHGLHPIIKYYTWDEIDQKNKYILRRTLQGKNEIYRNRVFMIVDRWGNPTNSIRRRTGNFTALFMDKQELVDLNDVEVKKVPNNLRS